MNTHYWIINKTNNLLPYKQGLVNSSLLTFDQRQYFETTAAPASRSCPLLKLFADVKMNAHVVESTSELSDFMKGNHHQIQHYFIVPISINQSKKTNQHPPSTSLSKSYPSKDSQNSTDTVLSILFSHLSGIQNCNFRVHNSPVDKTSKKFTWKPRVKLYNYYYT